MPVHVPPDAVSACPCVAEPAIVGSAVFAGGAAVTICQADTTWGIDWQGNEILFGQGPKGIMRVSADGGTPAAVVPAKAGEVVHGPQLLPGGQEILFTLATAAARTGGT